jgi:2-aminoadipate transaminase
MSKLQLPPPTSRASRGLRSSAIRELLAVADRTGVISMAGGLPAPETFPAEELSEVMSDLIAGQPEVVLQYSTTEGYRPLREWVAERHGAGPDQVVITSGSQQAMELTVRATVDPGAPVVLADPGYVGAIQVFQLAGASLHGVRSDHQGLDIEALTGRLAAGLRPVMVYVVPNFHNPTSATMGPQRRRRLAELAEHYGFLIIEDDPYGHLRWRGTTVAPISAMSERVVSIGTTSKFLSPGLRVGWVVAPPELATRIAVIKQAVDLHTSTLAQHAVHRMVTRRGFLDRHLARIVPLYQHRAEGLTAALDRHLGGSLSYQHPDGGMFVWGRFADPGIDTAALLPEALARGVAYVPGAAFAVGSDHHSELRLSFSTVTADQLDEGVARLASLVR